MSILEKVIAVTPSGREGEVDAIDLLKQDHDDVDALPDDYEMLAEGDGDEADRRALSTRICGLLDDAQVEHGSSRELIAQIGAARASDPIYDARVKVLGEYVRHHVKEEESELFPACRKSGMDLASLGARLQERKDELMKTLEGR